MPRRPQATFCPQIGAIIVALVTLFSPAEMHMRRNRTDWRTNRGAGERVMRWGRPRGCEAGARCTGLSGWGWQGGVKGLTGREGAGVTRARAACAEVGPGVQASAIRRVGSRAVLVF